MLIPDNFHGQSYGEKMVFNKFLRERNNYFVLHSVFLHDHIKNISGEIDFLVLVPGKGCFCLEVKHGPVQRIDGHWQYKKDISKRSPFQQASEAMHSIRKWIKNNGGSNRNLHHILFGHGVIFSGINGRIPLGTEAEQWEVLYRDELTERPISEYIDRLDDNWREKYAEQFWFDSEKSRPSVEDCEYLVKLIRGDFKRNYSELNKLLDLRDEIESFTEQQLNVLQHIQYNERILVEGYAGTGKTVLGTEMFRRYLEEGKRIGFFCYNRRLGNHLRTTIERNLSPDEKRRTYIGTLHSYLLKKTGLNVPEENQDNFFKEKLPMEFLLSIENEEKKHFDVLIIDEAQDLVTPENLEIFDAILKSGFDEGEWLLTGDFRFQNIYNHADDINEVLRSRTYFTRMKPLNVNCRNTRRISGYNKIYSGVPYEENPQTKLLGEEVVVDFVPEEKVYQQVHDILSSYKSEIRQRYITVIYDRDNTRNHSKRKYLKEVAEQNSVDFDTIHSYKGLENDIIVMVMFGNPAQSESGDLIYTGISRARTKLYIVVNDRFKEEFIKIPLKYKWHDEA